MAKAGATSKPHEVAFFPPPDSAIGQRYYYVTQRPWPSLVFILPMLLFFEIGTYIRTPHTPTGETQLVATYLIDLMIKALGSTGAYYPGLVTVVLLLAIHMVGKHPWRFDIYVIPAMLGESLIWTAPLFVFDRVLHTAQLTGGYVHHEVWLDDLIRSFGAGIYEELVFRLICITVLAILFIDLFKLPRAMAAGLVILASALIFASIHHHPLGAEPFDGAKFTFRTIAGLYLAGLFVFRGFGIAAGCHALYNVIVVTLAAIGR